MFGRVSTNEMIAELRRNLDEIDQLSDEEDEENPSERRIALFRFMEAIGEAWVTAEAAAARFRYGYDKNTPPSSMN